MGDSLFGNKPRILGAVIALMMGYILYQPVPDGFQEPLKLKMTITAMKVINGYTVLAHRLGLCKDRHTCFRTTYDMMAKWYFPDDVRVKFTDEKFAGVPVRLYEPDTRKEATKGPAIIYFHGGGFIFGHKDLYIGLLSAAAQKLEMPILYVGFRQSPRNPYPAPLEDCQNATIHFIKNAKKYNVDPNRIAIIGDGSGGNLAAALSMKLRKNIDIAQLKFQILLWPMLQTLDFNLPSYQNDLPGTLMSRRWIAEYWLSYFGMNPELWSHLLDGEHVTPDYRSEYGNLVDKTLVPAKIAREKPQRSVSGGNENFAEAMSKYTLHPHACPLMLKYFDRIPETYIFTFQYDLVRDDGIIYAKRLRKAGMKVIHKHWPSGYHYGLGVSTEEWASIIEEISAYIKRRL